MTADRRPPMPPVSYDPPRTVYVVVEKREPGWVEKRGTRAEAQAEANRLNREWRRRTSWFELLLMFPWHRGRKYVVRTETVVSPTAAWEAAYEEWIEPGSTVGGGGSS